jgi:hypothetical protein
MVVDAEISLMQFVYPFLFEPKTIGAPSIVRPV